MAQHNNNSSFSDDESDFNSNDSDYNTKTLKFLKSGGRSTSNQLLMEAVETSDQEEQVPLPDYERLSQSMRSPDEPDPRAIRTVPKMKTEYPPPQAQLQIPFAKKLIDKMFKKEKEKDVDAESVTSSEDGEEKKKEKKKKKKRSSWLPDPERRWPQGF